MADSARRRLYAAYLDLTGVPVLVVGGGAVAARKVAGLLAAGAAVTVISPEYDGAFKRLRISCSRLRCLRRRYHKGDVRGQRLVFAATNDRAVNMCIAHDAAHECIFVNVASPPEAGDLQVPASVHKGQFSLAVSTGGASAALAAAWRKRLEKLAGAEWGHLVQFLNRRRPAILERVPDPVARRKLLETLGHPRWAKVIKTQGARAAERQMDALIAKCARVQSITGGRRVR
jgi:precorrin-2 dehydrogenase / sirohydrochlorin ferrochelatase